MSAEASKAGPQLLRELNQCQQGFNPTVGKPFNIQTTVITNC